MLRLLIALLLLMPTLAKAAEEWRVLIAGDDASMVSGVAVDGNGTIYIVNTGGSRIEKLSPQGRRLGTIGKLGTGDDGLRRPRGIAIDNNGVLYVADTANHRIQRFSTDGQPLGAWGTIGSGPGEFILPTAVARDSSGNLFVTDTGNHRVQKLSVDGQMALEWGGVHFPHGIAVDAQDNVYVTDESGVRKFTTDGQLVGAWTAPGQFGDPYGITVDSAGTVYVADTDNGRIVALAPTGETQAIWGTQGSDRTGQFKYPEAVATDPQGGVYVADRGNDRVQVLQR
jgi:DNA-binding beta-propeller fold protein YncE